MRDGLPLYVLLKASKPNVLRLARWLNVPPKLGNEQLESMPRRDLAVAVLFAMQNPTLESKKTTFPQEKVVDSSPQDAVSTNYDGAPRSAPCFPGKGVEVDHGKRR